MKRRIVIALLGVCLIHAAGYSQSDGDYQSRQTGDWTTVTTWQVFNSGSFHNLEDAGAGAFQNVIPSNTSGIITLMTGTIVTIPNGQTVTADQIEYENIPFSGSTGALVVASGGTLIVNNGSGDDIRLLNDFVTFASLQVAGTLRLNTGATLVDDDYFNLGIGPGPVTALTYQILNGGVHVHTTGTGVDAIPDADWQLGSTCRIDATSGSVPSIAPTIAFHHFVWNGSGQTTALNLSGQLSTINGDFTIQDSNNQFVLLNQNSTLTILGNFNVQNNGRVQLNSTGTSIFNIGGDFNIASTSTTAPFAVSFNATGSSTVNVSGNFSKSNSSTVNLCVATGTTNLNILGNFSLTGGTLTKGAGPGTINFNGASTNSFTNSGTISGTINYVIASLKTLNTGTSALTGSGNLTLNGTIGLGSLDASGALQTGTLGGNIRVSGTRTYSSGSTIVYNGSGAQFIGNGFPSGGDVNLTISNPSNVTLSTSLDIVALRTLSLLSGNIVIGTQTLTINGTVTGSGGIVGGPLSNLIIGGTGSFGTLNFSGTNQLLNFTINRTSSGSVTLGGNLTILGTLTQTDGELILNGNTLSISGNFVRTSGTLGVDGAASLVIDGSGTLPSGSTGIVGSVLGNFTLNRSSSTLDVSASLDISTVNIIAGTLNNSGNLGVASGGTLTRGSSGSISNSLTNNTTGTSYNLVYNNTNPISTGPELPTNVNALNNLTKLGSGAATMSANATVNGILTLSSGTFNSGANTITLRSNFVSNATSAINTVIAGVTTTVTGSTVPTFVNLTINPGSTLVGSSGNMNVSGTWDNNGAFTPNGGLVTFSGASQTVSSNNVAFANVDFAGTGVKTINENLSVTNSLTISSTLSAGSQTITLAGAWVNNGTFTAGTSTVNFNGSSVISGSNATTFRNILITGTLNAPATLFVSGNITNSGGLFNAGVGTLELNGSSLQTISGSPALTFNNINVTNVANPNSIQITSAQNLAGTLTLSGAGSGTKFNAGNLLLTLLSTDDEPFVADAAIAAIPTGAVLSGNVIVQRYMSIEGGSNSPAFSNGRIYRYISSPVQGASVADLQNEIPVTGSFTTSSTCSGCGSSQSMFLYNESEIGDTNGSGANDANDGYVDFPQNLSSETFAVGRGYTFFVRGDVAPISTNGNARFDLRGPINAGSIDFVSTAGVSFTSSGVLANDGWNLIGNPYPSTIDWDAAGWSRSANVDNAIYMKDNGAAAGTYATYVNGVGQNGGSRYIPIGQAFWVKLNSAGTPTLALNETVKAPGNATEFFKVSTKDNLLRITLRKGSLRDETVVYLDEDANSSFDSRLDALKLDNSIFNLFTTDGDDRFAISAVPFFECAFTTSLQITNAGNGTYSLDFTDFESFTQNIDVVLHDKKLNKTISVLSDPVYSFEVINTELSTFSDRFEVTLINRDINPSLVATVVNGENCKAGSVLLEASGAPIGGSYRWYENETDTEAISDAYSNEFSTPELEKSRTYFVSVVNDLGCHGPKIAVTAEIINYDDVEIIDLGNGTLSSSWDSGNQWYKDGVLIEGATGKSFIPIESGTYKVETKFGSCTSSAERVFAVTAIEDDDFFDQLFSVFPNPVEQVIHLKSKVNFKLQPVLIDQMGKKIGEFKMSKIGEIQTGELDMRSAAGGVYILQIIDERGSVFNKRIVKQ